MCLCNSDLSFNVFFRPTTCIHCILLLGLPVFTLAFSNNMSPYFDNKKIYFGKYVTVPPRVFLYTLETPKHCVLKYLLNNNAIILQWAISMYVYVHIHMEAGKEKERERGAFWWTQSPVGHCVRNKKTQTKIMALFLVMCLCAWSSSAVSSP